MLMKPAGFREFRFPLFAIRVGLRDFRVHLFFFCCATGAAHLAVVCWMRLPSLQKSPSPRVLEGLALQMVSLCPTWRPPED